MKKITLRLDDALAKELEQLAKKDKRSINSYLIILIENQAKKKLRGNAV